MIFFVCVYFWIIQRGMDLTIYFVDTSPQPTEFESAVLFSHKHMNKGRKKTLLPLYFSFALFFKIPDDF